MATTEEEREKAREIIEEKIASGELIRCEGGTLIEADRFDPEVHIRLDPRITRAFKRMNESGIVAREDFQCCKSCGEYAGRKLADELDRDGVAFYHQQSADRAHEGGDLWIYYLATWDAGRDDAAIGEVVASCLRAEGLTVDWDGDPTIAIRVSPRLAVAQ